MPTTEVSPEGCTIERFTVPSPSMGREIKAVVVLPPEYLEHPEKSYPILYTFHGMEAPYDTFSAMPPLRTALRDKPMIVTCIDGDSASMYIDSPFPQKTGRDPADSTLVKSLFTTFFLDEFIPAIDQAYRVNSTQRMLTGFSMGGYGAIHYLLSKPSEFVAVSSLSGWFESWTPVVSYMKSEIERLLGPYAANQELYASNDPFLRIKKQVEAGVSFPPIYLTCGTEDFLLEHTRAMRTFIEERGIACEYKETSGGHDWPFWRDASPGIIDFHWRVIQGLAK